MHIKRTHNIGRNQSYPLSPSPVMSFIDYTLSQNNSTIVSSLRPRRSSRLSLVNSPLSGINNRPLTRITTSTVHHDMCDSQFVNTSVSQPPPPQSPLCRIPPLTSSPSLPPLSLINQYRSDTPPPVLSDVDPDDLDVLLPSPPRPSYSSSPDSDGLPDLVFPSADCIDRNVIIHTTAPVCRSPSTHRPVPPITPTPNLGSSPATTVAFIGCTGVNDVDVSCSIPGLSPETTVAFSGCTGVNDADVSCSTSGLSPETTVAFSGCTGVNDVDASCSILHPPPPILLNVPSAPLPPGIPNSSPTSSVAFSGCTDVDNDVPQTSQFHPNTTIPVDEVSHADNTINPVQAFHHKWSDIFTDPGNWSDFSDHCDAFAKDVLETSATVIVGKKNNPAPRRPNRPAARPVANNHRPLRYNPIEARRIQSLYRISKKRAARKVIGDNKPSYTGSVDTAEQYFNRVFDARPCDVEGIKRGLQDFVPTSSADNHLGDHLSPGEILKKLRSLSNSAPGKDRVEYRHLRAVDPKCEVLALIFNHCLDTNDVPASWKQSMTVLIHKKGDAGEISNFRPIALMSCIYKLFMSVMASRIVTYSIDNNLLSDCQKSARPSEGCYEHTFLLQSLVLDAKRLQKNVFLAWLDLRNAFGSVPHDVIEITLSHLGIPPSVVQLIKNVYTDARTVVRTPAGETAAVPILSGVKQGCPLSPIIFNLSVEIILRSILLKASDVGPAKHHDHPISVLAYADDLVLIARDKCKLQQLLDAASEAATLIGLEFRPDKCASLSCTYSKRVTSGNLQLNDFVVQGTVIPALKEHEHYRYLGVPIGMMHDVDELDNLVNRLCDDLVKINDSLLAPWQKLDAIRTFVQPCLTFALRAGEPDKCSLTKYRRKLIEVVRNICKLPSRATQDITFASAKVGGLGLHDPILEVDIQTIVQAIKMLSSSDPVVANIAKAELRQSVRFAARNNPTVSLINDFLSGSTTGPFHPDRIRYRTHSLWTRARKACRNLRVKFQVPDYDPPSIVLESGRRCKASEACFQLHRFTQECSSKRLLDLPDQGKVARALSSDGFASGSSWMYNGLNLRFSDWRFIHRARLNVVPTRQNINRWADDENPLCRVCNTDPETLPHILCHCPTNMVKIRDRHNLIVDRLVKAIRFGDVRLDQQVVGMNDACRPDVVIEDGDDVTVIDVTVPFENDVDALHIAGARKVEKYQHVIPHYEQQGKSCRVYGFVIGALGAWHPASAKVMDRIKMSPRYRRLFRKLCCSDAIRGSADIYYSHMSV